MPTTIRHRIRCRVAAWLSWYWLAVGLGFAALLGSGANAQGLSKAADSQQQLMLEVRLWLARHEGALPVQIQVQPLDSRLVIPDCPGGWTFALPFNNTQSVQARCTSVTPNSQYILRTEVHDVPQVVVTTHAMVAGAVLRAQDMALRSAAPGSTVDAKPDPHQWVGRILSQDLAAGSRVTPERLSSDVLVYRLTRAVNAGTALPPTVAEAVSMAATAAPPDFWNDAWPDAASVSRNLPAGHILRQDDWLPMVATVIAQVDIPRGVALRPEMLTVVMQPQAPASAALLSSVEPLLSTETLRPIAKGSAVSRHDVRAAVLVHRGDQVLISVGRGQGFLISARVEALEDGRLGSRIRLRNPRSGRVIYGVVTGANEVEAL